MSQVKLLTDECLVRWIISVFFVLKASPHISQQWDRSFEWLDIWIRKWLLTANPFPQTLHAWFFSFTWTPIQWILRQELVRNRLPQSWQEKASHPNVTTCAFSNLFLFYIPSCRLNSPNIKYSHRDPQKRHFLARNDVIWRILRKYPSRGVGCSLIEEPQKTNKN